MKQLADANRWYEISERAREFAQVAVFLMRSRNHSDAAVLAEAASRTPQRVMDVLRKSAVQGGGLADANWAGELGDFSSMVGGFVGTLDRLSAFDRLRTSGMMRLPLKTRVVVVTVAGTGTVVAEGAPKPITKFQLEGTDALALTKSVAIVVVSEELLRFTGAADFLGNELRKATAAATDVAFLTGLADGITPITSSGESSANFLTDLRALLSLVETSAGSRLYLLVTPLIAKQLAAKETADGALAFPTIGVNGGVIGDVQIVPTDGLPSGSGGQTIMLVDATGIAGESETITFDTARHSALQLDDAPDGSATNLTSLWQTNCAALKATRWFGFQRVRDSAVAVMDSADYSDTTS